MEKIEEFKDGEHKFEVFEESDKWFLKMKGAGETTLIKDLMKEEYPTVHSIESAIHKGIFYLRDI